jgi:hypothetical protein
MIGDMVNGLPTGIFVEADEEERGIHDSVVFSIQPYSLSYILVGYLTLGHEIALGIIEKDIGLSVFFKKVHGVIGRIGIVHDNLSVLLAKYSSVPCA